MGLSIAVLWHARQARLEAAYLLALVRQAWEAEGFRVEDHYGTRQQPRADLAFVHVPLSQVPSSYLQLAKRCPGQVNADLRDIRKHTFSRNLVRPGDGYHGPVIVKSTLNHFGRAERGLLWPWLRVPVVGRLLARRWRLQFPFRVESKEDYRIYPTADEVPLALFRDPSLVVERFLPERHGDLYCLREWYFLGDRDYFSAELSPRPVFTSGADAPELAKPPPPEVVQLRAEMRCEYGKIDYVLCDGRGVVFDVNKTIGVNRASSPRTREIAERLAPGIHTYLRRRSS